MVVEQLHCSEGVLSLVDAACNDASGELCRGCCCIAKGK